MQQDMCCAARCGGIDTKNDKENWGRLEGTMLSFQNHPSSFQYAYKEQFESRVTEMCYCCRCMDAASTRGCNCPLSVVITIGKNIFELSVHYRTAYWRKSWGNDGHNWTPADVICWLADEFGYLLMRENLYDISDRRANKVVFQSGMLGFGLSEEQLSGCVYTHMVMQFITPFAFDTFYFLNKRDRAVRSVSADDDTVVIRPMVVVVAFVSTNTVYIDTCTEGIMLRHTWHWRVSVVCVQALLAV